MSGAERLWQNKACLTSAYSAYPVSGVQSRKHIEIRAEKVPPQKMVQDSRKMQLGQMLWESRSLGVIAAKYDSVQEFDLD